MRQKSETQTFYFKSQFRGIPTKLVSKKSDVGKITYRIFCHFTVTLTNYTATYSEIMEKKLHNRSQKMMEKALFPGGNKTVNKETITPKMGEDTDQIKMEEQNKA